MNKKILFFNSWKRVIVAALVLLVLGFFPRSNKIHGVGFLQPEERYDIVNSHSSHAKVLRNFVESGQWVQKGQDLFLLDDDNNESEILRLTSEIEALKGEVKTSWSMLVNSRGALESAEFARLPESVRSKNNELKEKQNELRQREKVRTNLLKKARTNGYIVRPKSLIGLEDKSFPPGEIIMTIENPEGEWFVYLDVPEDGIDQIVQYQLESKGKIPVGFQLNGNPQKTYWGEFFKIDTRQENLKESAENKILVWVKFKKEDLNIEGKNTGSLQGAVVNGNVICGKTTNIGYYGRSFFNWFYRTWFKA